MAEYKKEFLLGIINHYQPMSKDVLTIEDGRDIAENLLALGKWIITAKRRLYEKLRRIPSKIWNYMFPFSKSKPFFSMTMQTYQVLHYGLYTAGLKPEKFKKRHIENIDYSKHGEVISWTA